MKFNTLTKYSIFSLILFTTIIFFGSCKDEAQQNKSTDLNSVISEMKNDMQGSASQAHSHESGNAEIIEVLFTDKYSYLKVSDQSQHQFWVAIQKEDVAVGDMIQYEDALIKKNFESKEFNRNFETLYLVSKYALHKKSGAEQAVKEMPAEKTSTGNIVEVEGQNLGSLFTEPSKWAGKSFTVAGKVVKVNFNIMGTNWVHLQNEKYPGLDLTITTTSLVKEGDEVSFTGTITLDKDFGAGYKYELIMENAKLN